MSASGTGADLDRAAATLAGHSSQVVSELTGGAKASSTARASMLSRMAEVHRRAAAKLDALALRATLSIVERRP
jgi:hypothetical protein